MHVNKQIITQLDGRY